MNVLLVEDNDELREVIKEFLTLEGHYIHEATNGIEAIEKLENFKGTMHFVITDLRMPLMNGISLLNAIAKGDFLFQKKILMSADIVSSDEIIDTEFLSKPFSLETLRLLLDN